MLHQTSLALPLSRALLEARSVRTAHLVEPLGLTRQAVQAHLRRLVEEGMFAPSGRGRGACYRLGDRGPYQLRFLTRDLDPGAVVRLLLETPLVQGCPPRLEGLLETALRELMENVLRHARAQEVQIRLGPGPAGRIWLEVEDDGQGIFHRLGRELGLRDPIRAARALAKGGASTDPDSCRGLGLHFLAERTEDLLVQSGTATWHQRRAPRALGVETTPEVAGTRVRVELDPLHSPDLAEVSREFREGGPRGRVTVRLVDFGRQLTSRSQAEEVCERLERFSQVVLDETGVETVSPRFTAFVRETWAGEHPEVSLSWGKPAEAEVEPEVEVEPEPATEAGPDDPELWEPAKPGSSQEAAPTPWQGLSELWQQMFPGGSPEGTASEESQRWWQEFLQSLMPVSAPLPGQVADRQTLARAATLFADSAGAQSWEVRLLALWLSLRSLVGNRPELRELERGILEPILAGVDLQAYPEIVLGAYWSLLQVTFQALATAFLANFPEVEPSPIVGPPASARQGGTQGRERSRQDQQGPRLRQPPTPVQE